MSGMSTRVLPMMMQRGDVDEKTGANRKELSESEKKLQQVQLAAHGLVFKEIIGEFPIQESDVQTADQIATRINSGHEVDTSFCNCKTVMCCLIPIAGCIYTCARQQVLYPLSHQTYSFRRFLNSHLVSYTPRVDS
jgi:hypothetical protein